MSISFVNRTRATRLMEEAGIDVLVVTEPEAFQYVAGANPGVAALFRRAGAAFAIIPADPGKPLAAVIPDYSEQEFIRTSPIKNYLTHTIWIETVDITNKIDGMKPSDTIETVVSAQWSAQRGSVFLRRPATYDVGAATAKLKQILTELQLLTPRSRIAMDLDFISYTDLATIRQGLDGQEIVDGSDVLRRLMAVKSTEEIDKLALGSDLAEAGLRHAFEQIEGGQSASDLREAFRRGVAGHAEMLGIAAPVASWEYISIGPNPRDPQSRVEEGFSVKADVGCVIDGYSSDCSRNFVFGEPSVHQLRLHAALEDAFHAGLAWLKPGRTLGEVHRAAEIEMARHGYAGYSRGHFGHGLGSSIFSEQWPFIAADGDVEIEPNMVLAFEIPIEIIGLGSFNLEDQILVTAQGPKAMNRLPRQLLQTGDQRSLEAISSAAYRHIS